MNLQKSRGFIKFCEGYLLEKCFPFSFSFSAHGMLRRKKKKVIIKGRLIKNPTLPMLIVLILLGKTKNEIWKACFWCSATKTALRVEFFGFTTF